MSRKISTLIELLQRRASETPDRTAYIFLEDGETETSRLTYAELHQRASAIGSWLQSHEAAGERALLLYPSGLDYIAGLFGCLYSGAIAVPAYPPRHNRTLDRFEGIINDAQPAFALTTKDIGLKAEMFGAESLKLVETDRIENSFADCWQEPSINEDSLAFLQYTSGSTAAPKGVMTIKRRPALYPLGLCPEGKQGRRSRRLMIVREGFGASVAHHLASATSPL